MPIDYKDYNPDFKKKSFFIRKYRAKDRCELCKAENGKPHPITGSMVRLQTGHLDQNKRNDSFFNLCCMCQYCHNRYDAKHRVSNRILNRHKRAGQLSINYSAAA